ncbi:MAG: chromosome segregation protein SMC [Gammaproteobacteria bacterium]|nr:MAG: chromosome segregation protein SMC [Gammaproteobacteria bacterium]RKZ75263.1 MAG: chromosome segregation protein SMC [Gammaproteobacteria bacterium]
MFIKKLQLVNFKRFTDLTIELNEQQLVLLIGANGSGKSCIFDAFEAISSKAKDETILQSAYYRKEPEKDFQVTITLSNQEILTRHDNNSLPLNVSSTAFYGRSSLRQVPQLLRKALGQMNPIEFEKDFDRPKMYIERDNRFENDIEKIAELILEDVFGSRLYATQIVEQYINPINEAFARIFGDDNGTQLSLLKLIPPLNNKVATILFKKGDSEIHYNYLGHGEKAIFNILINFLSRKDLYQETIYYLDEMDLHLNTKLQYALLKEIVENWLPDGCQLWTASHSLGFIDYAHDLEQAAIIDFDALNFDQPHTLLPQLKNRYEIFEIAVNKEFFSKIMAGKRIVFSENTDTPFYNNVGIENTIFFIAIDKNDVFFKSKNLHYYGLIDRDFLTDEEIQLIRRIYPNLLILKYYSIENYFYHPDNLAEYYQSKQQDFDKAAYIAQLKACKNAQKDSIILGIVGARNGYPFFRENEQAKLKKSFKNNAKSILALLQSNDFETFYTVFPAKDYGKGLSERQNLNKNQLSQTQWFKKQIQSIFEQVSQTC